MSTCFVFTCNAYVYASSTRLCSLFNRSQITVLPSSSHACGLMRCWTALEYLPCSNVQLFCCNIATSAWTSQASSSLQRKDCAMSSRLSCYT